MALATACTKLQHFRSKASGRYRDHNIEPGPDSDHHVPSKTYAGYKLERREEVQKDHVCSDSDPLDGLCHSCRHLVFGYREPVKVHYLPFYNTWSLLQWEEEMEPHTCQLCKVRKDIPPAWSRLVYRYVPRKVFTPHNIQRLRHQDIYSISPDAGVGSVADEIYTRIEEYSTRTPSYLQDILNAFTGVYSEFKSGAVRQDGHDHLYGHHFWGVPIFRYDGDNPEYKAVCSLVAGLTWRTGSANFYDRDSVSRPGEWPSWSWAAIMGGSVLFGATNLKDALRDSVNIWARLRHLGGRMEEVKDFVEGHQDSMDYQLSIDLSTWVLPGGNLIQDESGAVLFTHHSFDQYKRPMEIDAFLDVRSKDLGPAVTAAYLGCGS